MKKYEITAESLEKAPPSCRRRDQLLISDQVEWVVNDIAELGVKIGDQFFWLYKARSLVYESGKHDDGSQMKWRYVYKREFGECCHPWDTIKRVTGKEGIPDDFIHAYGDSDDWHDLPPAATDASKPKPFEPDTWRNTELRGQDLCAVCAYYERKCCKANKAVMMHKILTNSWFILIGGILLAALAILGER